MSVAKLFGLALLLLSFIKPTNSHAFVGPNLTSPSNSSTVSTTTLVWEKPLVALYATNPYRTQVDNNEDFSSPEKDTYTTNSSYTPTLTEGTWYWRVYYRDESGTKSDWSVTSSFTYTTQPASPSPVSTPTISPTSSPTVLSSPTPTPTATPSVVLDNFLLSGIPTTLDTSQGFVLNITLNNLAANQTYYLKGAFKKSDSSNYFGQTKVHDAWIKNSSTYSNQYRLETASNTSWTGQLSIMPDPADSGYSGSGQYIFKLARYDGSGNNLTWSSEYPIQLNGSVTNSPSPQNSPKPSASPSPSQKPSSSPSPSPSPIIFQTTSLPEIKIASIAGITYQPTATPSPTLTPKSINPFFNPKIWFTLAGFTFLVSASMIGHRAYKIKKL